MITYKIGLQEHRGVFVIFVVQDQKELGLQNLCFRLRSGRS